MLVANAEPVCEDSTEREELIEFCVGSAKLLPIYGVLHCPATPPPRHPPGVILLGGWSGTRVGPHGILVATARELASAGFYALRFDYRSRGDSGGEQSAAHIGTMVEDTIAAARFLKEQTGVEKVLILGVCAGAMVAMGAAPRIAGLAGMCLWSPPPFHPDGAGAAGSGDMGERESGGAEERESGGVEERESGGVGVAPDDSTVSPVVSSINQKSQRTKRSSRKLSLLKQYWNKLFDPRTWAKLTSGQLQPRVILALLTGKGVKTTASAPIASSDQDWAGPKPDERIYELALPHVNVPALFIYGTNDPEREEAIEYYRELRSKLLEQTTIIEVAGANHSFYSLDWKQQVIQQTMEWIGSLCAESSM